MEGLLDDLDEGLDEFGCYIVPESTVIYFTRGRLGQLFDKHRDRTSDEKLPTKENPEAKTPHVHRHNPTLQPQAQVLHSRLDPEYILGRVSYYRPELEQFSHACFRELPGDSARDACPRSGSRAYRNPTCNGGRGSSRASPYRDEQCACESEKGNSLSAIAGSFLEKTFVGQCDGKETYKRNEALDQQNAAALVLDGVADGTILPPREEESRKNALRGTQVPVADRIRAIEEKTAQAQTLSPPKKLSTLQGVPGPRKAMSSKDDSNQKSNVPMVFPLHVRRFVRRTSNGTPFRPETPLYRARQAEDPTIHSPQALRNMSIPETSPPHILQTSDTPRTAYKTPPDTLDTTRGDHDSSVVRNMGYGRRQSRNFAMRPTSRPGDRGRSRVSPAPSLHGTRENCVRHGRRPASILQAFPAGKVTTDMVERSSRTGTYVPTGLSSRRQMEATSPWKKRATEACPDCLTELNIKRREVASAADPDGSTATIYRPDHRYQEATSWLGEIPDNNLQSSGVPALWTPRIIPRDALGHEIPHLKPDTRTISSLVESHDLGDHLGSAVFICGGTLERVVLNSRFSKPSSDVLQKLSQNLLAASTSPALRGTGSLVDLHHSQGDRTVVLDMRQDRHSESLPELMDLIDDAVRGMDHEHDIHGFHHDASQIDHQSLIYSDEVDDVLGGNGISPGSRLVHRQTFHDYEQLQKQFGQVPAPVNREVMPVHRSWWWPLGRQKSTDNHNQPSPGAIPTIMTTQSSQRPSLSHTSGSHPPSHVMMTSNPTVPGSSPSPKSPVPTPSSNLLPMPSTSKLYAIPPPTTSLMIPQKKDGSGSAIHPSISEVLNPDASSSTPQPPDNSTSNVSDVKKPSGSSKTPPPITRDASPYHHAPSSPRDLHSADWAAQAHRRDSQHVRNAMRMDKTRSGRDAVK